MQIALTPSLTTAEALTQFVDSRELPTVSQRARRNAARTIDDYRQYSRALVRAFGSLPLNEIHVGHFETYQNDRAAGRLAPPVCGVPLLVGSCTRWSGHQGKCSLRPQPRDMEVGPNKINQELGLLRRVMLRAGVWREEMDETYERLLPQESDIPRALTPEEQERWLRAAEKIDSVVYWYSMVAFRTTASNVEMRGLRIGDVNLYQQVLSIQAAHAKLGARIRTVPLQDDGLWAMNMLIDRARSCGAFGPQHYIFPFCLSRENWDASRPMTVSGLKRPWGDTRVESGLPHFRQHDTRHTAITRLAEAGTPIPIIMSFAGHLSMKMLKHYTAVSLEAQRMAMTAASQGMMYTVGRKPGARYPPVTHRNQA